MRAKSESRLGGAGDDGAAEGLAQLAEDVLGGDAELAATAGAAEQGLRGLLVEDARVHRAVVDLAEGHERRERDAAVLSLERAGHEQGEDQRRGLVGERRIGFASEGGDLGALDGGDEGEL